MRKRTNCLPPNSSGTGPLILADLSVSPEVALEGFEAADHRLADAADGDRLVFKSPLSVSSFAGVMTRAELPGGPASVPGSVPVHTRPKLRNLKH